VTQRSVQVIVDPGTGTGIALGTAVLDLPLTMRLDESTQTLHLTLSSLRREALAELQAAQV
jgi:hypothetical protein